MINPNIYPNILLTLSIPATKASTSSLVLYIPNEARTVPSIPYQNDGYLQQGMK